MSCLTLISLLPVIAGSCSTHPRTVPADSTSSAHLVAEGVIQSNGKDTFVFLPVTIHGHAGTVILDVGAITGLALSDAAATLGIAADGTPLDSLTLGTVVERNIPTAPVNLSITAPPGMPPMAGILGTAVLSHYELFFDGPRHRVQLYQRLPDTSPRSSSHTPWLPKGLAAADCMPMPLFQNLADGWVGLPLQVNGHPITGVFDSGSQTSDMNVLAAQLLGLTQHSSNVQQVPDSLATAYPVGGGREKYEVTDLRLDLGSHRLSPVPVRIVVPGIPLGGTETPVFLLGLNAFRDRMLFVSYQTRQVCLNKAQ